MITSALSSDEFFRTVRCKSAKEMWEMLEITHEGTDDVRRSRKHALIHEYEMFMMNPTETISQMQTRFTHIVNHLLGLGKTFDNEELNIKILKCLTRSWQPKVTTIKESKDLSKMSMTALFGKLLEYELELSQLTHSENADKKQRSIALKAASSNVENQENSSEEDENDEHLNLIVKKFSKFMRRNKNKKLSKFNKKKDNNNSNNSNNFTCFECGKPGHIKSDCPVFLKKQQGERRIKKEGKPKKAYIAWEDNESTTSGSTTENEEEANVCLTSTISDDEEFSSAESEVNSEYDQIVDAFHEMHDEAQRLAKSNNKLKGDLRWHITKLVEL